MAQMISAKYAEEVICRELGVNHTQGIVLLKMSVDSKTVKVTVAVGPVDVEFVLREDKPTFKVTGKDVPGELYLQFDENMKSMVRDIFDLDGGLFDEEDYKSTEVKKERVVEETKQLQEPQKQIEERTEVIEAEFVEIEQVEETENVEDLTQDNAQATKQFSDEQIHSEEKEVVENEKNEVISEVEENTHKAQTKSGVDLEMTHDEIENIVDDIFGAEDNNL